jgi:integrase
VPLRSCPDWRLAPATELTPTRSTAQKIDELAKDSLLLGSVVVALWEKRDAGGRIFVIAVPALGTPPSRKASATNAYVSFGLSDSSAMMESNARTTRTVLSGILRLAARHDAIRGNLVRDAGPIREERKRRDALTLDEMRRLRARVAADDVARRQDLPDLVDVLAATGMRIGEALALRWSAVELENGQNEISATLMRVDGQGVVLREQPKTKAGLRIIQIPRWCVELLRRRSQDVPSNPEDLVFPAPRGRRRQPNNTMTYLRAAFNRAGYPEVTAHTIRRSVATLMDSAGLTAREAADQLGHARVSMTTDHYFGRRARATGAADVLEAIGPPPTEDGK